MRVCAAVSHEHQVTTKSPPRRRSSWLVCGCWKMAVSLDTFILSGQELNGGAPVYADRPHKGHGGLPVRRVQALYHGVCDGRA